MPAGSSPPTSKAPRLRASCDGCFSAKVKCSKERPICRRCLTCGTDCNYSPSSRSGKPRSDESRRSRSGINRNSMNDAALSEGLTGSTSDEYYKPSTPPASGNQGNLPFNFNEPWPLIFDPPQDRLSQFSSLTNTPPSIDEPSPDHLSSTIQHNPSLFDSNLSWGAEGHHETSVDFGFESTSAVHTSLPLPPSTRLPWFGNSHDLKHVAQNQSDIQIHPSCETVISSPEQIVRRSSASCNCFTTCLQALQALHIESACAQNIPMLSTVLSIGHRAVQGCALMLNCENCYFISATSAGKNTVTMLLATIIDKVLALYMLAFRSQYTKQEQYLPHSRKSSLPGKSNGEDGSQRPEIVNIWKEIRRIEELISEFQRFAKDAMVRGGNQGLDVHSALSAHLKQSLHFTVGLIKMESPPFRGSIG